MWSLVLRRVTFYDSKLPLLFKFSMMNLSDENYANKSTNILSLAFPHTGPNSAAGSSLRQGMATRHLPLSNYTAFIN